jgi:hypothetical protein
VDTSAETPACVVNASTTTIPPGGSITTCEGGGLLFKEVPSDIRVCGDGLPGPDGTCQGGISHVSRGTFMRLLPDPDRTVGNAYLTPYAVHVVADSSGDALLEPGESASISIEVLNAGPVDVSEASATLVSAPVDLTDDGIANPVAIVTPAAPIAFGTIPGTTPPSGACEPSELHPAASSSPFEISIPADQPGDTSHPVSLEFVGRVNGAPFSMSVPLTLGIADRCDPGAATRDYDGLEGLLPPMAKLVPVGDPVVFAPHSFTSGNTRPLKLRVTCGGLPLNDQEMDPPQIIGLSEATRGPLDLASLDVNEDDVANPDDPFFRLSSEGQWVFNLRTSGLGTGTFQIRIRIAGRKEYVTGFVLE